MTHRPTPPVPSPRILKSSVPRILTSSVPQFLAEWLLVAAIAFALTALLTYPVAFKLGDGGRVDTADGQFSIWNVAWVARALITNPSGVYDANIFYPHRDTLAYSEANLGNGALAIPAYWITGNPYIAHNVVFLLAFVCSAMAAYALVRHLTGSRPAAAVAAIAFAFCPYVFAHTAHIQLVMTAGLPLSLLALHRFVERRSVGTVVALPLVLTMQALCCAYYGIFAAMLVTAGVLFFAVSRGLWKDAWYWIAAGIAGATAIGMVWPFLVPYLRLQEDAGLGRTLQDSVRWSADWRAYLASSSRAHEWMIGLIGPFRGDVLFPGFLVSLLGLVGIVIAVGPSFSPLCGSQRELCTRWPQSAEQPHNELAARSAAKLATRTSQGVGISRAEPLAGLVDRRSGAASTRDTNIFYALVAVVALWGSFGPEAGLYRLAYNAIPLFSFLRAPSRFGIVVVLALSVLAGVALTRLLAGRRRALLIASAISIATAAELVTVPLDFATAPPVDAAYRTLARMPYGPVAEFPFFYRREDFPRHALYMLNSMTHWMPLINGYSDHFPIDFRMRVIPLSSFPNPESFALFQGLRLRYAIFHLDFYNHAARQELLARLEKYWEYLKPVTRENDVWLYEVVAWPPPPR